MHEVADQSATKAPAGKLTELSAAREPGQETLPVHGSAQSRILSLQRTLGNRRVGELIRSSRIGRDGSLLSLQMKRVENTADDSSRESDKTELEKTEETRKSEIHPEGIAARGIGAPPNGVIQREPPREEPSMMFPGDTVFASNPDIELSKQVGPITNHWGVKDTFTPLKGGVFIVDGIPITYGLEGEYGAETNTHLTVQPAMLEKIRIIVTGAEAERMRTPRVYPNPLGPVVGPPIIVLPPDSKPHGSFAADGTVKFTALAGADASAHADLKGQVGVFGALNAGAFAGIQGKASGTVWSHVSSFVEFRWTDGKIQLSTTLDVNAGILLAFQLSAYAGVEVELRIPDIPVVTNLTDKVQSWPIVGWFVPDLKRWRWSKRYQKEWPLLDRAYRWEARQRFVIGENSVAASVANSDGFRLDEVLKDLQAGQKPGELKDDPEGPGVEKRNSDTIAVSAAKAAALAQIGSAKLAATREKGANTRLLAAAKQAKAASATTGGSGPALASVTTGPADPVTALEKRGEKLDDALASTEQLRQHADALNAPASAPDGVSRNEARAGFEAIATNADTLSDKINKNEDVFAVPPTAEPSGADYEKMKAARIQADDAFDKCYDVVRTEKLFADAEVRAAGSDADLHPYRDVAVAYQAEALKLWNRVQKLEEIIEGARVLYEKHDFETGAHAFDQIEVKAVRLEDDGKTLQKSRPVPDWDTYYAELSGGHLQLQPQFRGKETRRSFYPRDYSPATRANMRVKMGPITKGADGKEYWEYKHHQSPRGDFLWSMDDEQERPTLDHVSPTVMAHWNYQGGRTTAYASRAAFYDFSGVPAANLVVVPKKLNSSSGARDEDSYTPFVTRSFRGSKR